MRDHGPRLRELVTEEGGDSAPAGDPAIRANLRFLTEALAAVAEPRLAGELEGFGDRLPDWFEEAEPLYREHLERGVGAIALETHLQHGTLPGRDPSLDEGLQRRIRITGWIRVYLTGLELHLGPEADGLADATLAWIGDRYRELARTIVTLDVQAKAAAAGRSPDPQTLGELGQAVAVQGHMRFLVQALEANLGERASQ